MGGQFGRRLPVLILAALSGAPAWVDDWPQSLGPPQDGVWSHPAFAYLSVYARNDRELVRVSLAADR